MLLLIPMLPVTAVANPENEAFSLEVTSSLFNDDISDLGAYLYPDSNSLTEAISPMSSNTGLPMVAAGHVHSLAINSQGQLFAWGWNYRGQLGDGTTTDRLVPTRIGTESNWTSVSAGLSHSLAINSSGQLFAWGNNWNGQLGDGTTTERLVPTRIGTESNWTSVSASPGHSLAINSQGYLFAWGSNFAGQLGDGTRISRDTPTRIGAESNWTSVSASQGHVLAINSQGQLYAWGSNYAGQLGLGDSGVHTDRLVPTRIGTESNWTSVSAGEYHSLAINSQGQLFAWGGNDNGQLGLGNSGWNTRRLVPTRIGTESNWVSASAATFTTGVTTGRTHSLAINTQGQLFAWGHNENGQLGLGDSGWDSYRSVPTRIGTESNWTSVSAGNSHSLALNSQEQLFSWGWNWHGQLGDDTRVNRLTPANISLETTQPPPPPVQHTVTFNSHGGSAVGNRQISNGAQIGALPTPTRANHNFAGWWTAATGGIQVTSTTAVTASKTLHARWSAIPARILPSSVTIRNAQAANPLLVNRTRQLSANVLPANAANRNVTWTSSNPRIATVNNNGLVRAVRPGTTVVTVRTNEGNRTARFTLRVQAAPTRVQTELTNLRMRQNSNLRKPIIIRGNTNTNVTVNWRTTNRNVATLVAGRANGNLTIRQNSPRVLTIRANRPGTARITLTTLNGRTLTFRVTVQRQAQRMDNVRITNLPRNNTMNRNATRNLGVRIAPQRATKAGQLRWTSSRPRVATIDQTGRVQAQRRGETTITLRVGTQVHRVVLRVR